MLSTETANFGQGVTGGIQLPTYTTGQLFIRMGCGNKTPGRTCTGIHMRDSSGAREPAQVEPVEELFFSSGNNTIKLLEKRAGD